MGGGGGSYVPTPAPSRDAESLEQIAAEAIARPTAREPRRRVFLSFRGVDLQLVNAFRGQAKQGESELDFIDFSLRIPFDSEDADLIKRGIRARIERCSVTLVLIGDTTQESEWVDWEIKESLRLGKRVVGVQIRPGVPVPPAIVENNIRVVPWDHRIIMESIEEAASSGSR